MKVLLGILDDKVQETQTSECNKCGGYPDWPEGPLDIPQCERCHKNLLLVVQMYCPLEHSTYHRTLYIFACATKTCWNHNTSWKVFRCQSLDRSCPAVCEDVSMTAAAPLRGNPVVDSWGADADDWGESDDDDAPNCDPVTMETHHQDEWNTSLLNAVTTETTHFGNVHVTMETHLTDENTKETDVMRNCPEIVQDGDQLIRSDEIQTSLQQLTVNSGQPQQCQNPVPEVNEPNQSSSAGCTCIADDNPCERCQKSIPDGNEPSKSLDSECIAEDNPFEHITDSILTSLVKLEAGEECKVNTEESLSVPLLPGSDRSLWAYHISVFEEPHDEGDMLVHEKHLLNEYTMNENIDLKTFTHKSSSRGSSAKGETYEKTNAKHGDKTFQKFQKRLSRCPEQILRYCYKGEPLDIHKIQEVASTCRCGSPRVFECQLMPALVNFLQYSAETDPAIEFGTVLIYTCEKSCWTDGATYQTEVALLQADPDHKLFKS